MEIPTISRTGDVAKKNKKNGLSTQLELGNTPLTDFPSKVSQCSFDLLSYP